MSVSEREMCLRVFSKQIALIHLFPYQSWQRLQLPGAPDSRSGCEWLAATHLQDIAGPDTASVPVQRHLQVPSGCPRTGKQWLQVRQGAKTELEVMSTFTDKVILLWGHWGGQQRSSPTFWLC